MLVSGTSEIRLIFAGKRVSSSHLGIILLVRLFHLLPDLLFSFLAVLFFCGCIRSARAASTDPRPPAEAQEEACTKSHDEEKRDPADVEQYAQH